MTVEIIDGSLIKFTRTSMGTAEPGQPTPEAIPMSTIFDEATTANIQALATEKGISLEEAARITYNQLR